LALFVLAKKVIFLRSLPLRAAGAALVAVGLWILI